MQDIYMGGGMPMVVGGERAEEDFDADKVDDILREHNHPVMKVPLPDNWDLGFLNSLRSPEDMIGLVKELKKLEKEGGRKLFEFEVRDDDEFQIDFVLTQFPRAA
jgi:hypothetical protein